MGIAALPSELIPLKKGFVMKPITTDAEVQACRYITYNSFVYYEPTCRVCEAG